MFVGSDEELIQTSTFRARCRLPVISWCHPGRNAVVVVLLFQLCWHSFHIYMLLFFISIAGSGAVIARSSQPLVGLMMNMRRYIEISILLLDLCMIIWFLIWILKVLEMVDSEVWYIYFTHFYSTSDEKLVTSFCTQLAGHKGSRRWASDFFVVWVQLTFRFTDDLFVIS